MASLNKVFLIGNLTRDPELRMTPKGTAICTFGLAVNRQFRDEAGGTREETTFVDLEAWGKTGELVSKYLSKGSPAMVEGRLRFDSWESKTGEKRNKLKVVVDSVQFLSSRGESGSQDSSSPERRQPEPQREAPAAESQGNDVDDDVPF
ncbi:MAG TPA: single-stranded DNA-binding protein [Opitutaceae bacterium]|nr:single-stranded DNA-binding protein [Opitutaceae bacterium]